MDLWWCQKSRARQHAVRGGNLPGGSRPPYPIVVVEVRMQMITMDAVRAALLFDFYFGVPVSDPLDDDLALLCILHLCCAFPTVLILLSVESCSRCYVFKSGHRFPTRFSVHILPLSSIRNMYPLPKTTCPPTPYCPPLFSSRSAYI